MFEKIELLEAAVEVVSDIVPGVPIEMDIFVRPHVCQVSVISVSKMSFKKYSLKFPLTLLHSQVARWQTRREHGSISQRANLAA